MKTQDIVTIASIALGTAVLTMMTFWSASLEASHDGEALPAENAKPRLTSHGVEVSLAAVGGCIFKGGDEPAFELQAVNPTAHTATATVRLAMTSSSPSDALSRVIRLPSMLWQHTQTLTLKPHETKALVVSTQTKLPDNSLISVSLQEAGSLQPMAAKVSPSASAVRQARVAPPMGITVMSFSTATRAAQPALASTR